MQFCCFGRCRAGRPYRLQSVRTGLASFVYRQIAALGFQHGIAGEATRMLGLCHLGYVGGHGGVLYASPLSGAGTDIGLGLEVMALTAAILGGNSLGAVAVRLPKHWWAP